MGDGTPDGALPRRCGARSGHEMDRGRRFTGTGAQTGAPIEHEERILPDARRSVASQRNSARRSAARRCCRGSPVAARLRSPSGPRHGPIRRSNWAGANAWRRTRRVHRPVRASAASPPSAPDRAARPPRRAGRAPTRPGARRPRPGAEPGGHGGPPPRRRPGRGRRSAAARRPRAPGRRSIARATAGAVRAVARLVDRRGPSRGSGAPGPAPGSRRTGARRGTAPRTISWP